MEGENIQHREDGSLSSTEQKIFSVLETVLRSFSPGADPSKAAANAAGQLIRLVPGGNPTDDAVETFHWEFCVLLLRFAKTEPQGQGVLLQLLSELDPGGSDGISHSPFRGLPALGMAVRDSWIGEMILAEFVMWAGRPRS